VCVHYLEINVLTAVINIGVLASILFKFISMLDS
jgi:hypothetical protein